MQDNIRILIVTMVLVMVSLTFIPWSLADNTSADLSVTSAKPLYNPPARAQPPVRVKHNRKSIKTICQQWMNWFRRPEANKKNPPRKVATAAATRVAKRSSDPKRGKRIRPQDGIIANAETQEVLMKNAYIKYSADASLDADKQGIISLNTGDLIIDTYKPLLVKVAGERVLIKAKTTLLMSLRDGVVKIRNLQESHRHSIHVFAGQKRFAVCAGEEFVAARDYPTLQATASGDFVQRRRIKTFELGDGTNIMCSEYALVSLVKTNYLLGLMAYSRITDDRKLFGKVVKMAACLQIATRNHGPYALIAHASS